MKNAADLCGIFLGYVIEKCWNSTVGGPPL
jgi:hypothetical protein